MYRYPVKVFNTNLNGEIMVKKFAQMPPTDPLNGTYDKSEFDGELGIGKSSCYAIEEADGVGKTPEEKNGTRYKGQLQMKEDGSVLEVKTDRGDDPILVPLEDAG